MKLIKKLIPIFSGILTFAIFAIIFALNNVYPFGELTVSWCDMDQQTIPLLCEFKDILSGKSNLWLSLKNAGGMNFFGVYFFNLSSPFTYLVVFFDKVDMPLAVNLMVVLKLTLSAVTMSVWLTYVIKKSHPIAVLFLSVAYAFSGYAMMYYQILSWLDTYYLFPLLLLGLERMGDGKSPIVYILTLFACMLAHFYLGYVVVVFLCLYGAVYAQKNKFKNANFSKNFILTSIISALLSAVVLIPAFLQYLVSMRSANVLQELKWSQFYPPMQTSLPTFFGLIIFAPFAVSLAKKQSADHLFILFLLSLVPVVIEPISMAWQTFDYMAFPTRYGFVTISLGLTLALKAITALCEEKQEGVKVNKNEYLTLACSIIAVAVSLALAYFSRNYFQAFKQALTAFSRSLWGNNDSLNALIKYYAIFLIFAVAVYFAIKYKIINKIAVYALIGVLCVTEAFFCANVYMVAPANDYSTYKHVFELENLIEDDDFYRVKVNSKNYYVNLTGALGYNSLAHYTSLNRESYMIAMKQLGYSSYWMEVNSNGGTIFTDALLRNKYTIFRGTTANADYKTQNYYVRQNHLLFPTAFIIDMNGENNGDCLLERWQIQEQLFSRLTGKSGLHTEYQYTNLENLADTSSENRTSFKLNSQEGIITYKIEVSGKKTLYFDYYDRYSNSLSEPTYDTVSCIEVRKTPYNSVVSKQYNYPSQSRNGVVELGTFTNATVTVNVTVKRDVQGVTFGVYGIDNEMLQNSVNELIGGDFAVEKDLLRGEITAKTGDALFTSFAFDEGYRVKINGKKAKTFSVNGFLAIELTEGKNVVKVGFLPKGLGVGIVFLSLGAIALALYLIFYKKIQSYEKLNRLSTLVVYGLGIIVFLVIYVMPVFVNLLL